ncbi:MAG: hypothetical protein PHQ96_08905 [Candidatus Omnitrophica bacterium]|nr:hypothetical protein [Candidatus Omnitrophota bacterium]
METEKERNKASLVALAIACTILFILATRWELVAHKFSRMYENFGMELPCLTLIVLNRNFIFIFYLIILVLIIKEFLKNKKATFIINVTSAILFPFILGLIYVVGLFLPIFKLSNL